MSLALVLVLAYVPALAGREVLRAWAHEDGPVESLGAAAFLAASAVFGAAWWRSRRSGRGWWTRRLLRGHPGYLALCAILFVACMEEISWGQRMLGLKTPDAIARVNRQGEINIHNLAFFHGVDRDHHRKTALELSHNLDRLFSAFNIVLGVVLPLAARRQAWRGVIDRLGVPLLSLGVGVLFLVNYGASKVLERFVSAHAAVEIKECNAALIWLALGVAAWLAVRERTTVVTQSAGSPVVPAEGLTFR